MRLMPIEYIVLAMHAAILCFVLSTGRYVHLDVALVMVLDALIVGCYIGILLRKYVS
jgi:hypothetical protein